MNESGVSNVAPDFGQISALIRTYMERQKAQVPFVAGETRIPLSVPTYGVEEVVEALDSLVTTWVTMGKKVRAFERLFAEYLGVGHALMVNSGSSANLLALSALANPAREEPLRLGDEVITPAVTWATTVFPILNVGAVPVLVDVELESYNLDPDAVERAITPRTRAILLVHLLGNPCEMDHLQDIARSHNLYLVEDACEAHGAEYHHRKVGTFGHLSTFSFFFSHHISTIEGGMVITGDEPLAELCRALRAFGWVRDLKDREELSRQHQEIDPRFLFVNSGFNLRPTEIQGAFGIHQIGRLEAFIQGRRDNAAYWTETLGEFEDYLILPRERPGTRHVWFGYPVTVRPEAPFSRRDLVRFLEDRGLETRPIMAGNMAEQPAMRLYPHRTVGSLANAHLIMRQSFFFGNHQGIGTEEREAVVDYFREFFGQVRP
jgi:CDP-6-deoxy-D-xylo-4-hexulose-3-dehydrase